ncbi:basic blue protein-like protein [Tanacetum coccineum]
MLCWARPKYKFQLGVNVPTVYGVICVGLGDTLRPSDRCYAFSDSLLLTPLCCDDIHDVTPRVFALAGCPLPVNMFLTSELGPVPSRLLLLEFLEMVVGNYRFVVEKDWYATFVVEVGIVEKAIVFNYAKGAHNVVVVNKAGYDGCSTTPRNAKVYTSGKDQIRLVKGVNNFICSLPGHCGSGMKIQVVAS